VASFPAEINLSVNNSKAVQGISKVERELGGINDAATEFNKTLQESVDTLRKLNNVASQIRSPFELAAAQKANTLLKQQVNAARERLKIRQAEIRVIEEAQKAQKALPGTALKNQKRLPARTSGIPVRVAADRESAVTAERQNRELFTARQRRINAEERLAKALEGEVSNVVRTRSGQGPFGLLPAKTSGAPVRVRRAQLQAIAAEEAARTATEDVARAARQQAQEQQDILRATARRAEAEKKLATAAEGQVSQNTRLGQFGPDSQKLLPEAGSKSISRRQRVIAAEVQRQFNLYGKITPELERLAVAYASQRGSAEELTSAQDQLTAEIKRRRRIDSESVTALGGRQQRLQAGLNRQNSASEGALKTATKLLSIEERLTAEQRAQLDLIRTVKGIRDNITGKTITELESTKGRKSIETRKKREAFLFERINKLAISVTEQEKLKNKVLEISKKLRRGELEEARKLSAELKEQIKAEKSKSKSGSNRGRRRRDRGASALVGGAFPALFGGGPGAIAGGFIGELFGNLGGVVGSALGTQLDISVAQVTKLGKALDPVNGDINTIVKSLGLVNTNTERYLQTLEQVAGKQVALEEATKQLALVVGDEGVQALKEFGEATTELGRAVSTFVTLALAGAAKLLKGPTRDFASGLTNISLRAQAVNSTDPRQQELVRRAKSTQSIEEQARLFKEIEARQRQINAEAQKEVEAKLNLLSPTKELLATEERKKAIAELNGDILNDQVLSLEKQELTAQFNVKNQKVLKDLAEKQLTYEEAKNKFKANQVTLDRQLLELAQRREKAEEKAAKERKRAAERTAAELLRLETNVRNEAIKLTKQSSLERKAFEGEEASIDRRLAALEVERQIKEDIIKDTTKNAQLRKLQLANLNIEYVILRQNLKTSKERLEVERKLQELQAANSLAATERSLQQELSGLTLGQTDEQSLRQEQANRYVNTLAEINAKIAEQNLLIENTPTPDKKAIEQALLRLSVLEEEKNLYESLLPQIFAAQQAQLQFNQTLELVQGPVNAFVSGITSGLQAIIDGTKSAEEAFADMLRGVADALVQTATVMIAQYIAIGIARAFAGIPAQDYNIPKSPEAIIDAADQSSQFFGGVLPYAKGGYVTGPTPALIGEGGEPEYVIPSSKMSTAMARYSQGARGSSVIPDSAGGGGDANNTPTFRLETTVINGVEYATVEQVRAMGQQAARQGAAAGTARTMSNLKNNRSTRSKLGM
jgi:hypothetical protein